MASIAEHWSLSARAQFVRQQLRAPSLKLRMGTEFFSAVPWQPFTTNWAMDLIGPLTPTKKGHKCIVTWVDRTSKMIFAAAAADGHMTQ